MSKDLKIATILPYKENYTFNKAQAAAIWVCDFYKFSMKSLLASKSSQSIFVIGIFAISIGLISKKVISYPSGKCMKGSQELTFKKEINKYFF